MESLIELANIENLDKSNIFPDYSQSLINGISNISKSQFGEHYHYLCKKCNNVPLTRFITKDKILFICKCEESPRELLIKDIYNFLFYSEEKKNVEKILKCIYHPNEYNIYYCEKCKNNLCRICIEDCVEHKKEIKNLTLDYYNIVKKSNFIIDTINKKNKKIFSDESGDDNSFENNLKEDSYKLIEIKENNNDMNNIDNHILIKEIKNFNNINLNENNKEYFNLMDEFDEEEKNNPDNLIFIVLDDYKNFPNYNHIETILSIEKFVILCYCDYNKINLN